MDRVTRNAIERATQRARKLLEEDFAAQLEGDFDVHRDGKLAAQAGGHLSARQAFQRERIVAAIEHKRAAGMNAADSVADYLRDAAFTALNRFIALKMLEARELVLECITKGEQSAGYGEFCGMAPGLPLLPDSTGYRLYIESVFDELSTEVKVLFDRRDPSSVLWPKRGTFEQLLEILNASELANVWGDDETIGWVYQFFNGQDERKKMREESQAPRNSRELAVRNQFFTPRYVVQFLTDNTLGRIWYEMRGTETVLAETCEYMVRKPGEEFAPRAKKDPRDLRVLDPACGSGHFLLYAFDLLLAIYEEAYADSDSPVSEATGKTLAADYPSLDALRKAIPGLILAHNLHGVDIDARCAQIAQLALWMRAQKAYRDLGVGRAERTQIRRSNIVVAEPLVADERIVKQFISKLDDAELGRVFTALVESLDLAGDLGLLLRVEQVVGQQATRGLPGNLFAPPKERIRATLARFVNDEGEQKSTRRRLFADDAAHGIALFSIAEKRFDVVLMNPPFGDATARGSKYIKDTYPDASNDIFAAFVVRGTAFCKERGLLGVISSRTGFYAPSLKTWRRSVYEQGLHLVADLGEGVMDAAMVEAAAYCIGDKREGWVFRHLIDADKEARLLETIRSLRESTAQAQAFPLRLTGLLKLQDAPLAYWLTEPIIQKLSQHPRFEPSQGAVRKGLRTGDNFRFVRAYWEVNPDRVQVEGSAHDTASGWVPLVMTGASQPWFSPIYLLLNWYEAGRELRAFVLKYGTESRLIQAKDYYFAPGFSWTLRAARLYPYAIPSGCVFTGSRPMAFPASADDTPALVSLFSSRTMSAFLRLYGEQFARPKFLEGKLKLAPIPNLGQNAKETLARAFRLGFQSAQSAYESFEPFLEFVGPRSLLSDANDGALSFDRGAVLEAEGEAAVRDAFGLTPADVDVLERDLCEALEVAGTSTDSSSDGGEDGDSEAVVLEDSPSERAWRALSYALGCVVGRWDIRKSLDSRRVTRSTGVRVRSTPAGSLELGDATEDYPIRVLKGGIAHDDIGTPHDLPSLMEECLSFTGVDVNGALQATGAPFGGLRMLVSRGLFQKHIGMYTLGRRKAPIYWQLATPTASYSVWLYIHAFSKDTLFRVQNDYAAPKLAHEERRLESLTSELRDGVPAAQRKALAAQEALVDELRAFLEEVKRVAPLWKPNLDDGVIINFAPLWRLVPQNRSWQKELKSTWDALCEGKYDWAHLAMHLWPERVVPKCAKDRSLAIAHGLEDVFWAKDADGKWTVRITPTRTIEELARERTSLAVKSALKSLLEAPGASGNSGGRRGGGRRRSVIASRGGDA